MNQDVLSKIVHDLVMDCPIPAKVLANKIGKPYSTLLREVNPYDSGAKLGAHTLLEIIKATGNLAPLEYMASELGMTLVHQSPASRASGRSSRVQGRTQNCPQNHG